MLSAYAPLCFFFATQECESVMQFNADLTA